MGGHARKLLACLWAAVLLLVVPLQAQTWEDYRDTFRAYVLLQNQHAPVEGIDRLAAVNWGVARGKWGMARRLAAKGTAESHYRMTAWLPADHPLEKVPRTDPYGAHYNLLALEAYRHGILPSWKDWRYLDEWRELKDMMAADPTLGAWLAGCAYTRFVKRTGSMDAAEKVWAEDPNYLKMVKAQERLFEKVAANLGR